MIRLRALLAVSLATLLWLGAYAWAYGIPPSEHAFALFVLPELGLAVLLLALFLRASRDLKPAEAAALVIALGAGGWAGADWLRGQQEVAAPDLARIHTDRRADPSGERPRSNLQMRSGPYRTVELTAVLDNDNDFPVWEVTVEVHFFESKGKREWVYPLVVREDLPTHGRAPLFWARRFGLDEVPSQPEWDVRVVRARRHWGGGPRPAGL